jgi:hypothetical protein
MNFLLTYAIYAFYFRAVLGQACLDTGKNESGRKQKNKSTDLGPTPGRFVGAGLVIQHAAMQPENVFRRLSSWRPGQSVGERMTSRGRLWGPLALFALITVVFTICTSARLNAQGFGTISGTITDPSGAVVASSTVTVMQTQTGRQSTTISGKDGNFVFPTLMPSAYTLTVSAKGFQTYSQTGIVLQANQALTINSVLAIGSGSETVNVSADAPQVDITTGTLSQVIDQARVEDLPLNGRNAAALITLVAGVADATNEGNGANQGNGKTFPSGCHHQRQRHPAQPVQLPAEWRQQRGRNDQRQWSVPHARRHTGVQRPDLEL